MARAAHTQCVHMPSPQPIWLQLTCCTYAAACTHARPAHAEAPAALPLPICLQVNLAKQTRAAQCPKQYAELSPLQALLRCRIWVLPFRQMSHQRWLPLTSVVPLSAPAPAGRQDLFHRSFAISWGQHRRKRQQRGCDQSVPTEPGGTGTACRPMNSKILYFLILVTHVNFFF